MSRKNVLRIEKRSFVFEIAMTVILLAQIIVMVCTFLYRQQLNSGELAIEKIKAGKYEPAVEIIQKYDVPYSRELDLAIENAVSDVLDDYMNEIITYEEAYEIISLFDSLSYMGFDFSETGALLEEISESRENMDLGKYYQSQSYSNNVAENKALAVNSYSLVSDADELYYDDAVSRREKVISEFDDYLSGKFDEDISDALETIHEFTAICHDEELNDGYISGAKQKLNGIISDLEADCNYEAIVDTTEIYIDAFDAYFSDSEYVETLVEQNKGYIEDWMYYEIANFNSYCVVYTPFEIAEKYDETTYSLGVDENGEIYNYSDIAGANFKQLVSDLVSGEAYADAIDLLRLNKSYIDKYSMKIGFSYDDKILSVYKKWYNSQKDSHVYLVSDDGSSALDLAKIINGLTEEATINISELIDEAAEYEKQQFIDIVNAQRKSNGNGTLKEEDDIDLLSSKLLNEYMNSGEDDLEIENYTYLVNECGISFTWETTTNTNGNMSTGTTQKTGSWWCIFSRGYASGYGAKTTAQEFIDSMTSDAENDFYIDSEITRIGCAIAYSEEENGFYWFVCVFTD